MRIETFVLGELQENGYLVFDDKRSAAVVIDPGDDPEPMITRLDQTGAELLAILLTHAHWDHIGGVRELAERMSGAAHGAPVYLHEADVPLYERVVEQAALFGFHADPQPPVDRTVKGGEALQFGPLRVEVIHTPGHSPGGVCYKVDDVVFVGDTIFAGGVGRADLPGGSWTQLIQSIRNGILTLADATVLYPGHGPSTTVATERATNPFLA
ncbi:MAG: MBL fold metallo-hydrolase [Verrucomicrobia bacterium]|nr:MBL fold metallo-hydrolase [Verrucomicrobiota bacterium]